MRLKDIHNSDDAVQVRSTGQSAIIFILSIGAFAVVNTQLGIIGILPMIAQYYQVSISTAVLMVSIFALVAAISALIMPLLLSGMERKKLMLLTLGVFVVGNTVSAFAPNFTIALIAYVLPAILHPVYCSMAFSVAAASVSKDEAPKAVSRVFIGVSATMVIGVPAINFIASALSLQIAMLSIAFINAIALIATFALIPSMPVKEKLSYGAQLGVLTKSITWLAIIAVVLMNGAVFGVYNFLAEYLLKITRLEGNTVSMMFLFYGIANIIGNIIAGKILRVNAVKTVVLFPVVLAAIYLGLFLVGEFAVPMALVISAWGVLGGIGGNINQYWVTSAAIEAPDFANGLFLSAANLGTTIATTVCGLFIAGFGIQYVVFGGLMFLVFSMLPILLRVYKTSPRKQLTA